MDPPSTLLTIYPKIFPGYAPLLTMLAALILILNGNFQVQDFKYSFGAGVHFLVDTEEKVNPRLDFAVTRGGSKGIYFSIFEAF